jgi:hypothetical protein
MATPVVVAPAVVAGVVILWLARRVLRRKGKVPPLFPATGALHRSLIAFVANHKPGRVLPRSIQPILQFHTGILMQVISLEELKEDQRYTAADWEVFHRLLQEELQQKADDIANETVRIEAKIKAGRSRIPHVHQTSFEVGAPHCF